MKRRKNKVPSNIWIGYSSLQLALGFCFAKQTLGDKSCILLFRKSKRYNSTSIGDVKVYDYIPNRAIAIFLYIILSPSLLWIPGISPTSCSWIEKLALHILYNLEKLRFYDDGMAGFVSNTYTWHHTLQELPSARGQLTWNQHHRSSLFSNASPVNVRLIKKINPGLDLKVLSNLKQCSLFVEANAMNISKLHSLFLDTSDPEMKKYYFAHTDKPSVARQFGSNITSQQPNPHYDIFYSHQYMMLESFLMLLVDRCSSLTIYSGCTSTILIILLYASQSNNASKCKLIYSPDYSQLHPNKIAQCQSFYDYIASNFTDICLEV